MEMRFKKINLPKAGHPVGETVQMYTGYEIPFVSLFRNLILMHQSLPGFQSCSQE